MYDAYDELLVQIDVDDGCPNCPPDCSTADDNEE